MSYLINRAIINVQQTLRRNYNSNRIEIVFKIVKLIDRQRRHIGYDIINIGDEYNFEKRLDSALKNLQASEESIIKDILLVYDPSFGYGVIVNLRK